MPLRPTPILVRTAQPAPLPAAVPPSDGEADAPFLQTLLRQSPPWLVSLVVHMILMIVLGVWMIARIKSQDLALKASYTEELGDQMEQFSELSSDQDIATDEQVVVSPLEEVDDPFSSPPEVVALENGSTEVFSSDALSIGVGLQGRTEGSKMALLAKFGGNGETEAAVKMALEWLAKNELPKHTGWSLVGPYQDGAAVENNPSATAMAMLAFQGAGQTHQSGKYKEQVAGGLKALLAMQDADGNFFQAGRSHDWLYTQAQCTIAICELYGMTHDSNLRAPAEKAVKFCIDSQDVMGGWRYAPRNDSDLSVTGWMVMALQSARMAKIDVPSPVWQRISDFLDKVSVDGGERYGYQPGMDYTESMTAEGLLCREYLGWKRDDDRLENGVKYLMNHLPDWEQRDVYYWYYATQVLHHYGGDPWKKWNLKFRDMLVNHQEKSGPKRGSWDPEGDRWGQNFAGRLYTTCLSVYMLEVYYRHLPIYNHP